VSAGESGLDISVAQDLHGRLPAALQAKQPALLDAASIEHADTAALQLFSAFFRAASASGIAVHWQ
jgi:anti-anti-sigma regulatory factor